MDFQTKYKTQAQVFALTIYCKNRASQNPSVHAISQNLLNNSMSSKSHQTSGLVSTLSMNFQLINLYANQVGLEPQMVRAWLRARIQHSHHISSQRNSRKHQPINSYQKK